MKNILKVKEWSWRDPAASGWDNGYSIMPWMVNKVLEENPDVISINEFVVSDGWYQLIYDLCTEIEEIYKEAGQPVTMKLAQAKSKFARLRWYYDLPGKEIFIGTGSLRMFPEGDEV